MDALTRAARSEVNPRAKRRMLAVRMMLSGVSITATAKEAGVNYVSARTWLVKYEKSGIAGIRPIPHKGNRSPKVEVSLVKKEAKTLHKKDMLTPGRICKNVKKKTGHLYRVNAMRAILHSIGYEPQKGALFKTWIKAKGS